MSTSAIELQVISKILTTTNPAEIDELCEFGENFYSIFKPHIRFILDHREKYGNVPDTFTFLARFKDIELVKVNESLSFMKDEMKRNRQRILLTETFNEIKDMTSDDPMDAWRYIQIQCDAATGLTASNPMDIVHDVDIRAKQIQDFAKQQRIPTGFEELDRLMYGGLSVVEELALFFGRTNTGKSWVASKMMESAQKNGFQTLYYSPEMQASYLGTRFDTRRSHFQNSQLHQGKYTPD